MSTGIVAVTWSTCNALSAYLSVNPELVQQVEL